MTARTALLLCLLGAPGSLHAASEVVQAQAAIEGIKVDAGRSSALGGVTLERGALRYQFTDGTLYPIVDGEGREIGAVFQGKGHLDYAPESDYLQLRLYRWTWFKTEFERDFSQAIILYTGDPLFKVTWGGVGKDPAGAQALLEERWALHQDWAGRSDKGDIWYHSRGPNLALDLMQEAAAPRSGPGMHFIEVNARPRRHAVDRAAPVWLTPERWWVAMYESPRGVMPLVRNNRRGALFIHGDSRYGYRADVLYAFDPPDYGAWAADDVTQASHDLQLTWDGQMERLGVDQTVSLTLTPATAGVVRLGLIPRQPLSLGSQRNVLEPNMTVASVEVPGAGKLPFVQQNGEILVDIPQDFQGALNVRIASNIAVTAGAQAHAGPFYLFEPVGHAFDQLSYDIAYAGPEDYRGAMSYSPPEVGSVEPPALAYGKYVTTVTESAGTPITAYAFEHQVFTGAAHAGQGREVLNVNANEGGGSARSYDTGSSATQSGMDGETRSKVFAADGAAALKVYAHVLGPLPAPQLSIAQSRGFHPAMTANVASSGLMTLDESDLFFFDVSGQESRLYVFQALAYELSRQWVGVSVAVGDELADFYFFDGLRRYLANYALEQGLANNPFLDQFLDLPMRWAVRTQQGGRKVQLGFDSGWETMNAGAEARGYLLFNNLRYAVGDANMNQGLKAAFNLLQGEPAYKEDLVTALESAFQMDLKPLFGHGVALAPYEGTLEVAYHVEREGETIRLSAAASGEDLGPTLGGAVRLTFKDMSEGILFVPLDHPVEVTLPMDVRKVEGFRRGSGLARRISVSESVTPLK